MRANRIPLSFLIASSLWLMLALRVLAQGPIVVEAVDDDPSNHLWNCETNRVSFGNEETDRSRCFTFRYQVPPEGITGATVHIDLNTLGSLQDTDATIVAVSQPVEACAWGQGTEPGCVVLHGGFKGGEKSLNLDLLNIACDESIPNTAENQQLVLQALQSGVLQMELQDDTAVYNARLVLNSGEPSFPCGTSEQDAAVFIPTPAAPTSSTSVATLSSFSRLYNTLPFAQDLNQFLTGTPNPPPPNSSGAATAAVAGAIALAILAISNYFLSGNSAVKSALEKARRRVSVVASSASGGEAASGTKLSSSAKTDSSGSSASPRAQPGDAPETSNRSTSTQTSASSRDVSASSSRSGDVYSTGGAATGDANTAPRGASSSASSNLSADASAGTGSPSINANSGAGVGAQAAAAPGSVDLGTAALAGAAKEGISTIPDLSDLVKDKLIDDEAKREKRRLLLADKKRLEMMIEQQQRRLDETRDGLKRVIDSGGDFEAAQSAWRRAESVLAQTRTELERVNKELAALDEKPQKE